VVADLAARLITLVSEYDEKWAAPDFAAERYLVCHHAESQVYLEGGFPDGRSEV
jgi:hypothetical protein